MAPAIGAPLALQDTAANGVAGRIDHHLSANRYDLIFAVVESEIAQSER